ncbi:MAG: MotA/TolQ/ExbB proton channel family protein [Candidatus Omnitrophica bacterium]|nr:MotA/TolQ/ExbB proton channel family protein [Candidatus Omnitrophota bacterium]
MNEISAQQLLFAGGPIMVPIILCSIAAITITINKGLYFKRIHTDVALLKSKTFSLIRDNKIKDAVALCENNPAPAARILKAGLLKFGSSRDEIKDAIEYAASLEVPNLEKGLMPLITIANITPLFGIVGTVLGMTIIFQTIQAQNAGMHPLTPSDLFGGIWQALLTTLAGLIVAIPTFVTYNYFLSRVGRCLNQMEQIGGELINLLTRLNESNSSQIADPLE